MGKTKKNSAVKHHARARRQVYSRATGIRRDAPRHTSRRHQPQAPTTTVVASSLTPLERATAELTPSSQFYIKSVLQCIAADHAQGGDTTKSLTLSLRPDSVAHWYRDGNVEPIDVERIVMAYASRTPATITTNRHPTGRLVTVLKF